MACGLNAARIAALPSEAFYIADFISEEEEAWLLQKVVHYSLEQTRCTHHVHLISGFSHLKFQI